MNGFDDKLLLALNSLILRHHDLGGLVVSYVEVGQFAIAGLVVALFMLGRRATRRGALTAGLSAGLAVGVAQVVTAIVDRPRPFVAHADLIRVLVHHGPDRSFPSDSATAAFAIATALYAYSPRWGRIALAMAAALAVGRVAVGMHYPTDVLAGAVLGAAVAASLRTALARRVLGLIGDRIDRFYADCKALIARATTFVG